MWIIGNSNVGKCRYYIQYIFLWPIYYINTSGHMVKSDQVQE